MYKQWDWQPPKGNNMYKGTEACKKELAVIWGMTEQRTPCLPPLFYSTECWMTWRGLIKECLQKKSGECERHSSIEERLLKVICLWSQWGDGDFPRVVSEQKEGWIEWAEACREEEEMKSMNGTNSSRRWWGPGEKCSLGSYKDIYEWSEL